LHALTTAKEETLQISYKGYTEKYVFPYFMRYVPGPYGSADMFKH